ncbi:COP9 signalosome complex subunit 12 [Aureobasidium pullulans]|uniref:Protein CSN12 homolog n=1 Tax=Aureobasidium pullulans TaxID=5580 RepID=A0A4S9HEJ9_AURPU|nr:COP9 signalosome complex subunit 12 [Aureobasidium pullulans]THX73443.1 COP9 signalosome complex subunit 12 [Aureobasidium pullulans]THY30662.1 COP9 signalosome complex subunit 12 [Aureobasidium pullulans]
MNSVTTEFGQAMMAKGGYELASTLSPVAPKYDSGRLYALHRETNAFSVQSDFRHALSHISSCKLARNEVNAWADVFVAYWKAVGEILIAEESLNLGKNASKPQGKVANWDKVYNAWKDLLNALLRGYQLEVFDAWTIPCLYMVGKYLRVFAIKADEAAFQKGQTAFNAFEEDVGDAEGGNDKLEDAARQINRVFSLCVGDRSPIEESRKWGAYYIANLQFKTYFKLNSIALSQNVIRSLSATNTDLPPLDRFPRSQQVTYNYYLGVLKFLHEDYAKAEEHLTIAYNKALAGSSRNIRLILTYLIPTRLITAHVLPTQAMLAPYPGLQRLFAPLCACIKKGDLAGFDAALQAGEEEFVKRRVYLTLERGRDICLRNLVRKVYLSGELEAPKEEGAEPVRRSRIPLKEFTAALKIGAETELEGDEVECLLANLIYKGMMKGYISRTHGMVVLNKKGAFPGTGV